MTAKVLVLTSSDDPREPTVRRAIEIAGRGGEVEILAVVYEPALEGYLGNREIYEPLRRRVLDERRERAATLARAIEAEGVRGAFKAGWSHPLHAAVADAAPGFDFVVAAPASLHQGSSGSPGAGLTHSDWQVVTRCPAPLLIVKSAARAPYRSIVAAVDPFHLHAKPATLDRDILRCAKALQERSGASLTAVHCHEPVEYFGADLQGGEARLEAVRRLCTEAGVSPDAAKVVAGAPHSVLTQMQRRGEADLVVMGALARGRLAELIVGHTAERVLHYGSGDVLAVAPPAARP
jgi:universal stress protein E